MNPRPPRPLPTLKSRALRYLAAREHSRAELQAKLLPLARERQRAGESDEPDEAVARLLDELCAKGFISDARVAESLVHRRAARLGDARVLHELRGKGLAPELVAEAGRQLKATELARAREVWRRKFGSLPGDALERARQMRFMAARGFSAPTVRALLSARGEAEAAEGD